MAKNDVKKINIAFQGGGSHGAFGWGVADRLLEEDHLEIEGITGTSAGAMNATMLAYGLDVGDRAGAKEMLSKFWNRVADVGMFSPIQRSPMAMMRGIYNLDDSLSHAFFDLLSRMLSPYQLNPSNYNPLQDIVENMVDFEILRQKAKTKLFISATNVRTGKVHIFKNQELSAKAVMASACLPFMFQAIEIDGDYYWDGGYMGNPTLFPLIYDCDNPDILLIQVNPLYREKIPQEPMEIFNRVNEISFNSSLMREMRVIDFITDLIDQGKLKGKKKVHMHMIENEKYLRECQASSKLLAEGAFLEMLRDIGYRTADKWLEENFDKIGKKSTLDVKGVFL